jgi:hypothetical protein
MPDAQRPEAQRPEADPGPLDANAARFAAAADLYDDVRPTPPDDLARLVAHPELLPSAVEEFLRAYAPVSMARLVKDDFEFQGCPMKKDDWIFLSFPAANRDPKAFDNADEVLIDREINRHSAFGAGLSDHVFVEFGNDLFWGEVHLSLLFFQSRLSIVSERLV